MTGTTAPRGQDGARSISPSAHQLRALLDSRPDCRRHCRFGERALARSSGRQRAGDSPTRSQGRRDFVQTPCCNRATCPCPAAAVPNVFAASRGRWSPCERADTHQPLQARPLSTPSEMEPLGRPIQGLLVVLRVKTGMSRSHEEPRIAGRMLYAGRSFSACILCFHHDEPALAFIVPSSGLQPGNPFP